MLCPAYKAHSALGFHLETESDCSKTEARQPKSFHPFVHPKKQGSRLSARKCFAIPDRRQRRMHDSRESDRPAFRQKRFDGTAAGWLKSNCHCSRKYRDKTQTRRHATDWCHSSTLHRQLRRSCGRTPDRLCW